MDRLSTAEAEDSMFTSISLVDDTDHSSKSLHPRAESLLPKMMNADMDAVDAENQVELEEKTRLINQVLELQHTLEGCWYGSIAADRSTHRGQAQEPDAEARPCKSSFLQSYGDKNLLRSAEGEGPPEKVKMAQTPVCPLEITGLHTANAISSTKFIFK
ncbi:short coiled-coil protein isoform X1 [Meriones unguiculatus]|uniref:short coiled-coil protein isoform X1 n=1 Tax=Meriones unguiculatus TaxID=10047 RepID=UPI00293ED963|nr:short coiled-coil protein isoform X1 [Meriones unguiculatus]